MSGINIKFVGDETGNDGYGKASVKCIQTSQVVSIPTGYKRVYGKVPVSHAARASAYFGRLLRYAYT